MRKILVALPCLLFSGALLAKEAPALDTLHGADSVLMATALDASHGKSEPVIRMDGTLEAATKKKKTAKAAWTSSAQPIATGMTITEG